MLSERLSQVRAVKNRRSFHVSQSIGMCFEITVPWIDQHTRAFRSGCQPHRKRGSGVMWALLCHSESKGDWNVTNLLRRISQRGEAGLSTYIALEPSRGRSDTDPTHGLGQRLGRSFFGGGCPSYIRFGVPQPTEWKNIGDQIDAAVILARSDFVNVRGMRSG